MKITLDRNDVLDLIVTALSLPELQEKLPAPMRGKELLARFLLDQPFQPEIEISTSEGEEDT